MKRMMGLCVLLCCVGVAQAGYTGYQLTLSGNTNVPTVTLANQSDSGIQIVSFSMTIGLTSKNFDLVQSIVSGAVGSYTLLTPDTINGSVRSDSVAFSFTGFDAGEVFQFATDIDPDYYNSIEDYREVLFNNDQSMTHCTPNSLITVVFSNDVVLSGELPDFTGTPYIFSQGETTGSTVPVPGAVLLGMLGTSGVGLLRRRRSL